MTSDELNDPILRRLARLPAAAPDAASEARVRARCHVLLIRQRRTPPAVGSSRVRRLLEPVVVGAFCLLYLSHVALAALRLEGLL